MRRSALLGLKTNAQNYHSSEVWLGDLDQLTCFCGIVLCTYFEVGLFIWKWGLRERYVEVEFAMIGSSCFAKWCLGKGAKPGMRTVSFWTFPSLGIILSSLSLKVTSRQAISTVFFSNGLAMRTLHQPGVAEVLWSFPTYRRRFHLFFFFIHRSKRMFLI